MLDTLKNFTYPTQKRFLTSVKKLHNFPLPDMSTEMLGGGKYF